MERVSRSLSGRPQKSLTFFLDKLGEDNFVTVLSFLEPFEQKVICSHLDQPAEVINKLAINELLRGFKKSLEINHLVNNFKQFDPNCLHSLDLSDKMLNAFDCIEFFSTHFGYEFGSEAVTDEVRFKVIKDFPNVKELLLHCDSDKIFPRISTALRNLEELNVEIGNPTETLPISIESLTNLRSLGLDCSFSSSVWEEQNLRVNLYKSITKLSNLHSLTLCVEKKFLNGSPIQSPIQSARTEYFESLPLLEHLHLSRLDILPEGLASFAFPRLCSFVCFSQIDDLSRIPNFGNLKRLKITAYELPANQFDRLAEHSHLEKLVLRCERNLSESIIKQLKKIPTISSLTINEEEIPLTDERDDHLEKKNIIWEEDLIEAPLASSQAHIVPKPVTRCQMIANAVKSVKDSFRSNLLDISFIALISAAGYPYTGASIVMVKKAIAARFSQVNT